MPADSDRSEPTRSEPTGSEPTGSEPTGSEPTGSEPTGSEPTDSEPTDSEPTDSEPTNSEPTNSEPTNSEPTGSDPTGSESTDSESTDSESTDSEPVQRAAEAKQVVYGGKGFDTLGLEPRLLKSVERSGYDTPTPIQARTIPVLLTGRDVLGQAQTGTGKTAAFALPLLQRVDASNKRPQVLVLTPTRELAIQVSQSFETYGGELRGIRVACVYGGQSYPVQLRQINAGAQIIVGTPGRVMDHMRRGSIALDQLQCLVLDEADEMLRMGFVDDVEWVLSNAPDQRQIALFSATMPAKIREIAQRHLVDPKQIVIAQKTATADTVRQRYMVVSPRQKIDVLTRILEAEAIDGVLVFVKMRSTTEPVAEKLMAAGVRARALNGDIPQKQRERIVDSLRNGRIDVIVATDVAARGLDLDRVSHVINYDVPFDAEAYIHRIGRTGRAGREGDAVLFMDPREQHLLKRLEKATRQTIHAMPLPSVRAVNKRRVAAFHERITEALGHPELEVFESIVHQFQRNVDVPVEKIAAALAIMANNENALLVREELEDTKFVERRKRGERGERGGRGERRPRGSGGGMVTYRAQLGRRQRIEVKHLVGALVNAAGIPRECIGKIRIFDHFSTIDLANELPPGAIEDAAAISIGNRSLGLEQDTGPPAGSRRREHQGNRGPRNGPQDRPRHGSRGGGKKPRHGKR